MKRKELFSLGFLISNLCIAQVGINTPNPQATLDITLQEGYSTGDKAGITVPLLTGDQIEAIHPTNIKPGTLVYSVSPSTAASKEVYNIGYWFWKNSSDKWEPLNSSSPTFFYSPSVVVITDVSDPSFGTIDLYNNYKSQFTTPMVSSIGSAGRIYTYNNSQLEYYITWYDTSVFTNVQISEKGVLTYQLSAGADTSKPSYMNVVFVVK
ncbi:hypothetical protein [Chryseobacterium jejuense]|uniref:Uncharacterized protein n=1 Tax=Chryseobacterium jejuense TaxID=445960 RepID=A0A2X2XMH6_CHRJE|nr:hypothetical protein [Chryseobacterium jejuense]SDI40431.1 hypothetical protein SAMN05421542_1111 [Chryseobacterium jejuense]SQB26969.1 Uncharacterised protein [Chryseobacterium jejuense]